MDEEEELGQVPKEGITQSALAELLALKPADLKAYPYRTVWLQFRWRTGECHLFSRATVRDIVRATGGWTSVLARRRAHAKRSEAGFKAAATRKGVSVEKIKKRHAAKEARRAKFASEHGWYTYRASKD